MTICSNFCTFFESFCLLPRHLLVSIVNASPLVENFKKLYIKVII